MNAKKLLAMLPMFFLTMPVAVADDVASLRALCKEQERQIQLLEEENALLKAALPRPQRNPGTQLISTSATRPPAASPQAATATVATYEVRAGDSLERIARHVGSTPAELAKLNGIKVTTMIHPGQKLKTPQASRTAELKTADTAKPKPTSEVASYKVKSGDTFYSIARNHGISANELMSSNPGIKPTALRVGQTLQVTRPMEAAASAKSAKPEEDVIVTESIPKKGPNIRPVVIEEPMTYGEFAAKYGSQVDRLNELNSLDLFASTVLARGSELYIPAQP